MVLTVLAYALVAAIVLVFYIWPACAPLWWSFVISVGVALAALFTFWDLADGSPIVIESSQGVFIELEINYRAVAAVYLMVACALQGLRHWAISKEVRAYRHWVFVLLGAILVPVFIHPIA